MKFFSRFLSFFFSPKLQPNRYDYRNSCHKELGFGLNQSPRGCLSSLTTATDFVIIVGITVGITVGNFRGFLLMEFIDKFETKNNKLMPISFRYFISLVHSFSHSLNNSYIWSFIHSFIHTFIHSFIHSSIKTIEVQTRGADADA